MPQPVEPDDRLEFPPAIAEVVDELWESVQAIQTLPMAAIAERLSTLDRQAQAMDYRSFDDDLQSVPPGH